MSQETGVILRTILFQIKTAGSIAEIEKAVEVMCSKKDVAVVEKMVKEYNEIKIEVKK